MRIEMANLSKCYKNTYQIRILVLNPSVNILYMTTQCPFLEIKKWSL
uniref:Uncharacterized protein n=1 Tax=Lepeophtheirus salmonis TaxID=72036 RepID=A0A0K2TPZ9_LEPSM